MLRDCRSVTECSGVAVGRAEGAKACFATLMASSGAIMASANELAWQGWDRFAEGPPSFQLRHPEKRGAFLRKQFDLDYVLLECTSNVPLFHTEGPRKGEKIFVRH
eukprot:6868841-Alexandrium_andersonii.AAC.1